MAWSEQTGAARSLSPMEAATPACSLAPAIDSAQSCPPRHSSSSPLPGSLCPLQPLPRLRFPIACPFLRCSEPPQGRAVPLAGLEGVPCCRQDSLWSSWALAEQLLGRRGPGGDPGWGAVSSPEPGVPAPGRSWQGRAPELRWPARSRHLARCCAGCGSRGESGDGSVCD